MKKLRKKTKDTYRSIQAFAEDQCNDAVDCSKKNDCNPDPYALYSLGVYLTNIARGI